MSTKRTLEARKFEIDHRAKKGGPPPSQTPEESAMVNECGATSTKTLKSSKSFSRKREIFK